MLTQEEEKFVAYWQEQRQRKKEFLKKFSIGLPVMALLCIAFFVNFLSGWYQRADNELRKHSSLLITILVAVVAIVVFMVVFSARYKFDQNESDYQSLLAKKQNIPHSQAKDGSS